MPLRASGPVVSATQRSATSRVLKDKCKFGPPPFSGEEILPQPEMRGSSFSETEIAHEGIPPRAKGTEALTKRPNEGDS